MLSNWSSRSESSGAGGGARSAFAAVGERAGCAGCAAANAAAGGRTFTAAVCGGSGVDNGVGFVSYCSSHPVLAHVGACGRLLTQAADVGHVLAHARHAAAAQDVAVLLSVVGTTTMCSSSETS